MLRLQSDLVPYLLAAATGRLAELPAADLARRGGDLRGAGGARLSRTRRRPAR